MMILPSEFARPSLRWSGIENATRGIVYGPSVLSLVAPREWSPNRTTFKIVIRARDGGEILWTRPFGTMQEAALAWMQILRIDHLPPHPVQLPGSFIEGELEYLFATVVTFNATGTWTVPASTSRTDYLVVAGAGGSGSLGGSGGAGGYLRASAYSVTSGDVLNITIGAAGTAGTSFGDGGVGGDSVFNAAALHGSAITAKGGGFGAGNTGSAAAGTGGSGGGARSSGSASTGGAGTGGQGNTGGNNATGSPFPAGSGGSSSAVGNNGAGSQSGNGRAGTSDSISGSSVARAASGGASGRSDLGLLAGAAGDSTAGAGSTNGVGGNAAANSGSSAGGGGYDGVTAFAGGVSAAGVVILSFGSLAYSFGSIVG